MLFWLINVWHFFFRFPAAAAATNRNINTVHNMADSDDEYDRKRRDKFRGERSSGDNYRSDRRDERSRGREEWVDR